jgi:hypothetical protein
MFKLFASAALVSLLAACAGTPTSTASMNAGPDTSAMGAAPMDPGLRNMTGGKAGGPN